MRLSPLQKYILKQCYLERSKIVRSRLIHFYTDKKVKKQDQVNIITKSIERLVSKGLLIGYGVRTAEKWFIKEIRLTKKGVKQAKEVISGKQQKLKI